MNIDKIEPYIIYWDYFTNYPKNCDNIAMRGATYALVFNKTKPDKFKLPCEYEQCVYIGKSAGYYYDKQNGYKGKVRSHVHKRMTNHHKPLITGEGGDSSHKAIIEEYGYGEAAINGIVTGLPLWLCLLIPRPDVPDETISRWTLTQEQIQLYQYEINFGHCTLGNMDTKENKDPESYSSYRMSDLKETNLEVLFG
jgi:hypothetical protein|tara:strand:+ start:42 stop:629 length:588 start_codon:yes stop_codon:yes gene_type:complete